MDTLKSIKEIRDYTYPVRLTKEEWFILLKKAKAEKCSVADIIRRKLFLSKENA